MIQFKEMTINGFASIQDLKFSWSGYHGVVILSARNGSGKSRLINALYWVLFGKSLYGSVNTWDHIKPVGYKGTKVELELDIDGNPYRIVRCMDWTGKIDGHAGKNRFIVYENGKEWNIKDKRDIQGAWLKVLKYSPNLFLNSILFGQKQRRMLDNKSTEKKELFDEAFDVTILNKAYAVASNETKEILQSITNLERDRQNNQSKLSMVEEERERQEKKEREFYEDIKRQISRHEAEIERLSNSDEVKSIKNDINHKEVEISKINKGIKDINEKIQSIGLKRYEEDTRYLSDNVIKVNSHIMYLNKTIEAKRREREDIKRNDVCPTCGHPYDKGKRDASMGALDIEITNLVEKRQFNIQTKVDLEGKEAVLRDKKKRVEALEDKIKSLKHRKSKLESEISGHKLTLSTLENKSELIKEKKVLIEELKDRKFKAIDYTEKIRGLQDKIGNLNKEILKLRVSKKRLQFSQHLFSNRGIKSWLFSYLLDSVNRKLMDYASVSGFEINFWVDLESAKGDIYSLVKLWGEEVPYEDLSGGQQQLVNLLTIFAVMDVIQEKRPCPLFIGDELFESLDSDNIRIVSNLVQQKAQEKKMVIVTHMGDFIIENAQVIKLENHNGTTVLS